VRKTGSTSVALALAVSALLPSRGLAAPELVVDVASGQVLHAEEATRPWFPASTTKMMTAYVALRAIKAGHASLETPLIASARAASQPPSKIGIRPGQEITLDNALKVLMVKSANDVAVVIAEGIGGSVDGFAQLMNQEAARLGMSQSHFVNPHGLHNTAHVSSARDLALLGRAMLVEFPQYRDYWGIGAVQLGRRIMRNTNGLIGRYPGAEGIKTGFVCASGFNVVGLANRGGRTLMTVVLGAGSGAERTIRSAQLFDRGFSSWGGGYGTLTSLPGSGYGSAPDMRGEICRKGRQIFLGEEEDSGGAIAMPTTDNASVYAVMAPVQATAARSVGGTAANGRAALGPRADLIPVEVSLGRAPGSTAVARGAGNGAVAAARATAFAPLPSATRAGAQPIPARAPASTTAALPARPAPQPVEADEPASGDRSASAPLQLPGVITTPSPGAIGLRQTPTGKAQATAPGAIRAGTASSVASQRPGAIAARTPAKTPAAKAPDSKAKAKVPDKKTAAARTKADSKSKKQPQTQ